MTATLVYVPQLTLEETQQISLAERSMLARTSRVPSIDSIPPVPAVHSIHHRPQLAGSGGVLRLRESRSSKGVESKTNPSTHTYVHADILSFAHCYRLPKSLTLQRDGRTIEHTSASDWISRAVCRFDSVYEELDPSLRALPLQWKDGLTQLSKLVRRFISLHPANLLSHAPNKSLPGEKMEEWRENLYRAAFQPLFDALKKQNPNQESTYTIRVSAVHLPRSMPVNVSSGAATSPSSGSTASSAAILNHSTALDVLDSISPLRPRKIREEEAVEKNTKEVDHAHPCASRRFEVQDATELPINTVDQLLTVMHLAREKIGTHDQPTLVKPSKDSPPKSKKDVTAASLAQATDSHVLVKLLLYVSTTMNDSIGNRRQNRIVNEMNLVELAAPCSALASDATDLPHSPNTAFTLQSLAAVETALRRKIALTEKAHKSNLRLLTVAGKIHVPYRACALTKLLGSSLLGVPCTSDRRVILPGGEASVPSPSISSPATVILLSITKNPLQLRSVERALAWTTKFTAWRGEDASSMDGNVKKPISKASRKTFLPERNVHSITPLKMVQDSWDERATGRASWKPQGRPEGLQLDDGIVEDDESCRPVASSPIVATPIPTKSTRTSHSHASAAKRPFTSPIPPHVEQALSPIKKIATPDSTSKQQHKKLNDSIDAVLSIHSTAEDDSLEISFSDADDADFSITSAASSPGPIQAAPVSSLTGVNRNVNAANAAGLFTPNYHHAAAPSAMKPRKARSLSPVAMMRQDDCKEEEKEHTTPPAVPVQSVPSVAAIPVSSKPVLHLRSLAEIIHSTCPRSGSIPPLALFGPSQPTEVCEWTVRERLKWSKEGIFDLRQTPSSAWTAVAESSLSHSPDPGFWTADDESDLPFPTEHKDKQVEPIVAPALSTPLKTVPSSTLDDSLSLPSQPASLIKLASIAATTTTTLDVTPVRQPKVLRDVDINIPSATRQQQKGSSKKMLSPRVSKVQQPKKSPNGNCGVHVSFAPIPAIVAPLSPLPVNLSSSSNTMSTPPATRAKLVAALSVASLAFDAAREEWESEKRSILHAYKQDILALTREIHTSGGASTDLQRHLSPLGLTRHESLTLTQQLLKKQSEEMMANHVRRTPSTSRL